jgi:hypothetical protein
MRDLLYHVDVTVVSEPDRIAEQHVSGGGYVSSFQVRYPDGRYGSAPFGRFAISTAYHYEHAFWVRDADGVEDLIQMEGAFAPVRQGHQLTLFIAQRGNRRGVLVGFHNHTSNRHHRVHSGRAVLDMLSLPVEEEWSERPAFVLSTAARRERERTAGIANLLGVGGVAVALVGGILCLTAMGNREPAGGLFVVGLLLGLAGIVAFVFAVAQWLMANGRSSPPRRLHYHCFGEDFNQMYREYRQDWAEGDRPPRPPALTQ